MSQQPAMLPFSAAHQLFMQQLMLQQAMQHAAAGQNHGENPTIDIAALFAAATHANNNNK